MIRLTISEDNKYFLNGNKKFFYLADTIWSTFTNVSIEEWKEYLHYRKMQGFNALQINILQQWDASESDIDIKPFRRKADGAFDFYSINEEYFKRAEKMVEMAVNEGFVPALVLLWCNYIPDTWASKFTDKNNMPLDAVEGYVKYAADTFSKFNPIYVISGDTDFPSELAKTYYTTALNTIKSISPECLTTFHICGRLTELPEEYINSRNLDFYMYQSGHNSSFRDMSYKMALNFSNKPVKRPVINSEPCYDQMGFSRRVYGRFTTFDVRKAAWQSLLSGASAGITYGAHGIWSWHKAGKKFAADLGEAFDNPYDWRDALRFDGAWDYAFAKWIFETYDLSDAEPMDKILNDTEEIRMAGKPDLSRIAVYIPSNTKVRINMELENYDFIIIDLDKKHIARPDVEIGNGKTIIQMHNFCMDALVIGIKNKQEG